jgi:hypothetical protein
MPAVSGSSRTLTICTTVTTSPKAKLQNGRRQTIVGERATPPSTAFDHTAIIDKKAF